MILYAGRQCLIKALTHYSAVVRFWEESIQKWIIEAVFAADGEYADQKQSG